MKVSVAMCTYNGEKYIEEQLNSILCQTKKIDEIIICDDGSKDKTIEICTKILKSSDVEYTLKLNKENLGFANNFYQAITLCSGDIIFFSDQDDVWKENKVDLICRSFDSDPNALLVFSNAYITNENLDITGDLFKSLSYQDEYLDSQYDAFYYILNDNFVTGATTAIKKEILNYIGDLNNGWAHDYWFGVVAALNGGLKSINDSLIYYRQHDSNTIGIGKKYGFDKIKKLFSKNIENNRENQYAELRLPQLNYLKNFISNQNIDFKYREILEKKLNFWKKREHFGQQGIITNVMIVIKGIINKEQINNRNVNKAILKDLIKAIALAKRDKRDEENNK